VALPQPKSRSGWLVLAGVDVHADSPQRCSGRNPRSALMTDPSSSNPDTANRPVETRLERIARRAREIYEARGGADGRDLDDWLAAEREIDAQIENEK
jgi:hypothetical protein